jgi:O-antigen/teichoic acid export membrane protein
MGRALVRIPVLRNVDITTAFWTAVVMGTLLALLSLAMAPLVAVLFDQPRLTTVIRVLSILFIFAGLDSTQSALADRALNFRVQAVRRFLAVLVSSVVAILLALRGAGVWALVAQMLSLEAMYVIVLWGMVSWRPSFSFSRQSFRELFGFGSRFLGIKLLTYAYGNVDNLLVGIFLGADALGIYAVAYRVLSIMTDVLTFSLAQVALPIFARRQDDIRALSRIFYRATQLAAAIGWPIFVGLMLVARDLVPQLFGTKWALAGTVLAVLAVTGLAQCGQSLTQTLMLATNQVGNEMRWTALVTTAAIIGFILTVHFGVVWVAASLAIVTCVLLPVRVAVVARLTGVGFGQTVRSLLAPAMACAVMALAVLVAKLLSGPMSVRRTIVEIITGAITYAVALRVLSPTLWRSLRDARRILRREAR